MKVIFFVTGLDSGGLENYLLRFLQFKASAFSAVEVYCKSGRGGQLEPDYLKIPNVTIIKKRISFFKVSDYIFLKKYFERGKYDCICDFTGNFAGIILWMASLANVKSRLVFYRGASDHFSKTLFKSAYNSFVKKLTYKYATSILSNSQAAFDYFFGEKKMDKRFEVIHNGIDSTKFLISKTSLRKEFQIPQEVFLVGHTGRFNYAKNHKTILEVAYNLVSKYKDIYFFLCGNGVKSNLETTIKSMGIESRVVLSENRSDIPEVLNALDVYFFPSITEGQPNALIEAMLVGLPIVASNIAPIKETVLSEDYLFNFDDVYGFQAAIEEIYIDKKPRDKEMQGRAMKKFDHKERFEQFYNRIIL